MNELLEALEGARVNFDPARCNHAVSFVRNGNVITYKAAAADCPHCLRFRLTSVEQLNALLAEEVVWARRLIDARKGGDMDKYSIENQYHKARAAIAQGTSHE
ncbi:MAG: hypothetical protein R3D55_25910 [Chloroflexota bacterium]